MCLLLSVGCAGVLDLYVARWMSTTYDEPQFVDYGEQVLHCQPDRSSPAYDSKSPATALNALPRVLASYLDRDGARPAFWKIIRSIRFARIPSLLATLLLNFFIYRWPTSFTDLPPR